MYDAWDQPGDLSAAAGLRPVVRIRVMRDGTVSAREMIRRSGNAAMDESAMRAATAVTKLRPLPAEFQGPYRDITVEFELTGSGV
jgi:TonB family protein